MDSDARGKEVDKCSVQNIHLPPSRAIGPLDLEDNSPIYRVTSFFSMLTVNNGKFIYAFRYITNIIYYFVARKFSQIGAMF